MKEFDRNSRVVALGLTDLQKAFAERYIEHFNGARAVREAGSKQTNPGASASLWLKDEQVLAYIEILKEDAASRVDLRLDRVLREQMRIGFSRIDHFAEWTSKGIKLKTSGDLSEDDLAAVQEIIQTETPLGPKIRVKLHPKQPALDQLLKYVDTHDGDQKVPRGSTKITQKITINAALQDPKARSALELLSNRLFSAQGRTEVPLMTATMQQRIAALTEARLVEYSPPPLSPVDLDIGGEPEDV